MRRSKTKSNINKNDDYYCGLDLSLTGTGIVILNHDGSLVHHDVLKNKFMGIPRLHFLKTSIINLMNFYRPKVICIENYSMGSRAGQAFSIGELGGVIKLGLFNMDLTYNLVAPTQLKKFITGKGQCEKSMIILKVFKQWGWEPPDDNQADAYGLAQIARALKVRPIKLLAPQKEVIKVLINPPEPKKKKKK